MGRPGSAVYRDPPRFGVGTGKAEKTTRPKNRHERAVFEETRTKSVVLRTMENEAGEVGNG